MRVIFRRKAARTIQGGDDVRIRFLSDFRSLQLRTVRTPGACGTASAVGIRGLGAARPLSAEGVLGASSACGTVRAGSATRALRAGRPTCADVILTIGTVLACRAVCALCACCALSACLRARAAITIRALARTCTALCGRTIGTLRASRAGCALILGVARTPRLLSTVRQVGFESWRRRSAGGTARKQHRCDQRACDGARPCRSEWHRIRASETHPTKHCERPVGRTENQKALIEPAIAATHDVRG